MRDLEDGSGRWRAASVVAGVLMVAAVMLVASCTDTMQAKRGGLGEFCNGADVDCREGLICSTNDVCIRQNRSGAACRTVCDTFERCQVGEQDCFANCAASLSNWRREAVESYASCYESVSDSACEAVREFPDGAQNYCVSEIESVGSRVDTCESFESFGRTCLADAAEFSVENFEQQFSQLNAECRLSAKTYSEQAWTGVLENGCERGLEQRECEPLFRCLNDSFDIGRTEQEAGPNETTFPPFPTSRSTSDSN